MRKGRLIKPALLSWFLLLAEWSLGQQVPARVDTIPQPAINPRTLSGQAVTGTPIDTSIFPAQTFYELIRQNHPIVRQANLFDDEARQVLLQARGAFDPKLATHYDRKEFGNDLYYDHWQNKLAVPIWPAGIDLNLTYDRNDPRGKYINPEERTPPTGLTGVGLSVPIGQPMFIDARRNAVRQGRLAVTMAEAERISLINKTLLDAAKSYWDWFLAHQKQRLLQEGFEVADRRFNAVRLQALLGDAASIDTTEALITAQDRLVQLQQSAVDVRNARLLVNVHLWNADGQPVELPEGAVPQSSSPMETDANLLQTLIDAAAQRHPDLIKLDTKIGQLTLEERFRRALIQPQVNVSAYLLSATPALDVAYDWGSYYSFRPQNYKVGLDLVFPLFLRKERGKLREVQVKNQQTALERQQTNRDILTGVQTAYNQLQTLGQQVDVQQRTVTNQRVLLAGELQKFELGESSLFLVNSRETKLIDLRIKGEELKAKYQKAIAELYYSAGTSRLD